MGQPWLMESSLQGRHLVGIQHGTEVPLWGRREWLGGSTAGGLSPVKEVLLMGQEGVHGGGWEPVLCFPRREPQLLATPPTHH